MRVARKVDDRVGAAERSVDVDHRRGELGGRVVGVERLERGVHLVELEEERLSDAPRAELRRGVEARAQGAAVPPRRVGR